MEALNGTTIDGDLGLGIRLGDRGSQEASVLSMPCEMDNYGIFCFLCCCVAAEGVVNHGQTFVLSHQTTFPQARQENLLLLAAFQLKLNP